MTDDGAPEAWRSLRWWWGRGHLIDELDELASPSLADLWLNPTPGRLASIDDVFHFFFDDHQFDEGAIGVWLFDRQEVEAIAKVTDLLDAILNDPANPRSSDYFEDNRYFLTHPKWRLSSK